MLGSTARDDEQAEQRQDQPEKAHGSTGRRGAPWARASHGSFDERNRFTVRLHAPQHTLDLYVGARRRGCAVARAFWYARPLAENAGIRTDPGTGVEE